MDAGLALNENNGRNSHARTGVFAAVPFSPEGAGYDSPGQRPGDRAHQIGSPARAESRSGGAWISPLQGFAVPAGTLPQGVALGFLVHPAEAYLGRRRRPKCGCAAGFS